jgi:hypothetical protein
MVLILLVMVLCGSHVLLAQGGGSTRGVAPADTSRPYTPEKGSSERKAIVDALRTPVEKKLKQPVIFKIDHLKVQNGWAFLLGIPQRPDGSAIDYQDTIYQKAISGGAFDDGIVALLHNMNGKWRVTEFVIGATDVPYVDWDKKYRAPKAIFEQ